ncbi:MAG TPA: amidohydrolase family protein [candidate division Zixibacteria bacterium]|nr:amidohydrolase family protein [candidate division Zixibacteria bacterium]
MPETRSVIDGDGHIFENHEAIWSRMPREYRGDNWTMRSPFPPNDHLHAANRHFVPDGAFRRVDREGWVAFMEDTGIGQAVLYPSSGLAFGRVVSRDWAIELARAYNDWLWDEYLKRSDRFYGLALIPLQEPAAAVEELRRAVRERGFCGAMLPSTGAPGLQNHLGDERYWPIYEEADRLGCAIAIHGGVHDHMGLDDMSPYAPVNALGHPFGQMVNFGGLLFNGIFDKYPNARFGFMEAGSGWFVGCIERFERSWNSHVQYDPRGRFLKLRENESITDYIRRHVREGRIFVGVEGDELTLPFAVRTVGSDPFIFSSDFPHEVNNETCKHALRELEENPGLGAADKEAIRRGNAVRFYGLSGRREAPGRPRR